MTSKLEKTLRGVREAGKKALVPYICAGYPSKEITAPLMHALVDAGATAIELGIPFSDPMADGEVIQHASEVAVAAGVSLGTVLDIVREFREKDKETPVVLMGYANPFEKFGVDAFVKAADEAGVSGVLVVDYPPHESSELWSKLRNVGIDMIYMLAPTSTEERIKEVAEKTGGYLYYVTVTGVTGTKGVDVDNAYHMLPKIREYTDAPIAVGFGIVDAESAVNTGKVADAVIIGSQLIREMDKHPEAPVESAASWLKGIRKALDEAK